LAKTVNFSVVFRLAENYPAQWRLGNIMLNIAYHYHTTVIPNIRLTQW